MTTREALETAMDKAIKPYIDAMAKGLSRGGFPMNDNGDLQNWSSWIARRQIDAVMDVVEKIK